MVSTRDDILALRPCYREQVPGMAVFSAAPPFDVSPVLAATVNRASVTGRVLTPRVLRYAILARRTGSATTTAQSRMVEPCARIVRVAGDGCRPDTVVHREVYE